eukprot:TRINITY_DN8576_c0_g2_i1.p1 TRINITY_DN8576_c0_g2~~TRINITY_DN8576_c0_g2_i1.p1  ORF type:complete len:704 (+),score=110.22 TRINITY_DN8576_c0_g2_i1:44-2155(+)
MHRIRHPWVRRRSNPAVGAVQAKMHRADKSLRFKPDSLGKCAWDFIVLLGSLYYGILIPLALVLPDTTPITLALDLFFTVFFICDIVVNFNTAIIEDMRLEEDAKTIRRKYLRGWFFLDLVSSFPGDLLAHFLGFDNLRSKLFLMRSLRLFRLFRIGHLFLVGSPGSMSAMYVHLFFFVMPWVTFAFWVIFAVHILTVIALALTPSQSYIVSLYWVVMTITTVGYGDVPIEDSSVRIYSCFLMVLGVIVQGLITGSLTTAFDKSDVSSDRKDRMRETLQVLRYLGIPKELRTEVLAFQYHTLQNGYGPILQQVVSGLPTKMTERIGLYMRVKLISAVPLFSTASADCKVALAGRLYNEVANPGQFIIAAGEDASSGMYFLTHGYADILAATGKRIATIQKGSFFGEAALLSSQNRNASVRALTFCDLFRLARADFNEILLNYPDFAAEIVAVQQARQAAAAAATASQLARQQSYHITLPLGEMPEAAHQMATQMKLFSKNLGGKQYQNCFLCSEAVTFLHENVLHGSGKRSDAVLLLEQMWRAKLVHRVRHKRPVMDGPLLFRLAEEGASSIDSDVSVSSGEEDKAMEEAVENAVEQALQRRNSDSGSNDINGSPFDSVSAAEIAQMVAITEAKLSSFALEIDKQMTKLEEGVRQWLSRCQRTRPSSSTSFESRAPFGNLTINLNANVGAPVFQRGAYPTPTS